MIELTKMNNEKFYLNPNIIEEIEITPDSLITTISGKKYYVLESIKEIQEKFDNHYKKINSNPKKNNIKMK